MAISTANFKDFKSFSDTWNNFKNLSSPSLKLTMEFLLEILFLAKNSQSFKNVVKFCQQIP